MVFPTRPIATGLDFSFISGVVTNLDSYATFTADDARTTRDTITGLDWSGGARTAAVNRANSEYTQLMRVSKGFDALSKTISSGCASLKSIASTLRTTAAGFESNQYAVSDRWHVSDKYNYELATEAAAGDQAQLALLGRLKAKRADQATNGTNLMTRLADEFDTTDSQTATSLRTAAAALDQLAHSAATVNKVMPSAISWRMACSS